MRQVWLPIVSMAVLATGCAKKNEAQPPPAQADSTAGTTGSSSAQSGSGSSSPDSAAMIPPQDSLLHTRKAPSAVPAQDSLPHGAKPDTLHTGASARSGASPSGKHR